MIVARATLSNRTYELVRNCTRESRTPPPGNNTPFWWREFQGWYETPAAAIDALWGHLGLTVAVEGWWKPVVDGLDISAAKRPVTVTEQELILAGTLGDELAEVGLCLETDAGTTPTRAHRALAHRRLRRHFEQLIAEELLEQVALAHELECELQEGILGGYEITNSDQRNAGEGECLAAGDTPLAAVLELQRDLDAGARWTEPPPPESHGRRLGHTES